MISSTPPPITLRQITAASLATLQELYEGCDDYFLHHSNSIASPDQAAGDYQNVLESGDRVLLGVWWQGEELISVFDLRFNHPVAGVVWFGALIMRDVLPAPRNYLATWTVSIMEEWLRLGTEAVEIRLSVSLSDRERIRFWTDQGYTATPEGIRHSIGGKQKRFAIFRKEIVREDLR